MMPRNLCLIVPLCLLAGAAAAQTMFNLGTPATKEEIASMDTLVDQEGRLMPAGRGTVAEGAAIYAQRCAMCHGPNGEGTRTPAGAGPTLVAKDLDSDDGIRHMHFATTLWSYIYRAMPMHQERTLTVDQAYALSAFLLHRNGIIRENEVMTEKTLPEVRMPYRDEWEPPPLTSG